MKGMGVIQGVLVLLAAAAICLPQPALAAGAAVDQTPVVIDVALQSGGLLLGQVVNPQGIGLAKVPVSIRDRGREVATTQTDNRGRFAVRGLRTGVYQLVTTEGHGTYRLWQPGTAPPTSQQGVLLVAGQKTVRGQCPDCGEPSCGEPECATPGRRGLALWLANPWVVAGIVGTAVAVPVSIHNADRPTSP